MAAKLFDDILLKGVRSGQAPGKTKASREWYRKQAAGVDKAAAKDEALVKEMKQDRGRTTVKVGNMYMFKYDAKHKDTLPYYDAFPLIFPINRVTGGFYGINMHYLPPALRAKLMDALYSTVTNKKYDDTTRMKLSYDVLSSAAKFKMFSPCIKRYLNSQVQSRFIYVEPSEWDIALFLPSAQFIGASKQKVWADSRKTIKG